MVCPAISHLLPLPSSKHAHCQSFPPFKGSWQPRTYNSWLTRSHLNTPFHQLVSYVTSLHLPLSYPCCLSPAHRPFPLFNLRVSEICWKAHWKNTTPALHIMVDRRLPSRPLASFSFNPSLPFNPLVFNPPCLWIEYLAHANCGIFSLIHHNCFMSTLPFRLNVTSLSHATPTVCLMHVWCPMCVCVLV